MNKAFYELLVIWLLFQLILAGLVIEDIADHGVGDCKQYRSSHQHSWIAGLTAPLSAALIEPLYYAHCREEMKK